MCQAFPVIRQGRLVSAISETDKRRIVATYETAETIVSSLVGADEWLTADIRDKISKLFPDANLACLSDDELFNYRMRA